jgi:hypothetical protein
MKNAANREALGYGQDDSNIRQNLADAECPEEAVSCFMSLRSGGNIPEQPALDCLDFLVFTIKKQSGKNET